MSVGIFKNERGHTMKRQILVALLLAAAVVGHAAEGDSPKYEKLPEADKQPALVMGDSLMSLLSSAMKKELKKADYSAESFVSLGSGLARIDAFDWYSKIEAMMKQTQAATVVVMLGANDKQPLQDTSGNLLQFGTAEWRAEYGMRVGKAMDAMITNGARHVIWMLLPDMKEHSHQNYAQLVNAIQIEQAAVDSRKDKVVIYDVRPLLTRKPGVYSSFIMSPQGEALEVRDSDGVHFTNVGAKIIAKALVDTFWRE